MGMEAFGGHIGRWRIGVCVWKGGLRVSRCKVALRCCDVEKG